jgi:xanthine dehydrogenase small subunit
LRFLRNGRPVELDAVGPNETLLDYLRLRERANGTKEGCNEGDCGACTVALGRLQSGRLVYEPVNACIRLLGSIDGCDLVTVEDLAAGGALHPVQQAMVDHHGSQCGFCTPGIVMSLFCLAHSGEPMTRSNVNDWLAGNLCRCTGYRPIADAAAAITLPPEDALARRKAATLKALKELDDGRDLVIGDKNAFVAAPATAASLARLCARHPDATIVGGATDVGLWITKQLRVLPKTILTGRAKGFADVKVTRDAVRIGGGATYAQAGAALAAIDPDVGEVLRRIGSMQVRATGTVGGNIANGSPIGDTPPILIALGATLELHRGRASRRMAIEDFFIAYGKQDRRPGELVAAVTVPKLKRGQHFRAYKISKRFDQDISALLAAIRLDVVGGRIAQARIAFGGMAATPRRAKAAEEALAGARLDDADALRDAQAALTADFQPISDMRAGAGYRMQVAQNLLAKALAEIAGARSDATRVTGLRERTEARA